MFIEEHNFAHPKELFDDEVIGRVALFDAE